MELGWVSNNRWNDRPNRDLNNIIGGIAEIKLDPNNTPTGRPVITGTFQEGQTLTADISNINDADNFQGWTPTYTYSWNSSYELFHEYVYVGVQPWKLSASLILDISAVNVWPSWKVPVITGRPVGVLLGSSFISAIPPIILFKSLFGRSFQRLLDTHPSSI